eukprot:TRINITY_DN781917_c0_g1_i1.p1 TRINITY_DN781917_c0_g1~~TRINITY_DN781917_c0_g1_i1.p1  ORF type:complete len:176 (+),score=23.08 TRINITY_DN781917_c0_g1_i1:134-661(+)
MSSIEEECSICCEVAAKWITILPCDHRFCEDCFREFDKYERTCPQCRIIYTHRIRDGKKRKCRERSLQKKKYTQESVPTATIWSYLLTDSEVHHAGGFELALEAKLSMFENVENTNIEGAFRLGEEYIDITIRSNNYRVHFKKKDIDFDSKVHRKVFWQENLDSKRVRPIFRSEI